MEQINKGLKLFIDKQILQFNDANDIPIHFIGSISYYLQDELKELFNEYGLSYGKILRRPIDGLLKYHISKLK